MYKLLKIVGGRVVEEDVHRDYVHMILEKTALEGKASPVVQ